MEVAVELRKTSDLAKAERLLRKYASPADFDRLAPDEKIHFLQGVLELAHVRALKDDVPGALVLLNWAEGRKDDYQRAIACVKYAEILVDLGEFERAGAYLKSADEIIVRHFKDEESGTSIGQGGVTADSGAVWRKLGEDSATLKTELETETLKKKFGATYANYVKLRRLQQLVKRSNRPRFYKEAMETADEIIKTDPASQFAAAAGYLKGELLFSKLTEKSSRKEIKNAKEYLEKFVKQQPEGLYRGEALMLLGKISLEIEWNAIDAEKYYSQALDWFRKSREKRDAVSLYAAMNDDLKKQTEPIQKPTTLNQWKRTVYHDEDPLKLYNTANAPAWYVSDKEKDCLFCLGFLKFLNGNFAEAGKLWDQGGKLNDDIMALQAEGFPNTLKRILIAAKQGFFITDPLEHRGLSPKEKLFVMLGEFYFLEEKFDQGIKHWRDLQRKPEISPTCEAIAIMGEADCLRMLPKCDAQYVVSSYNKVINDRTLSKTSLKARAMYNLAWITLQSSSKNRVMANDLFEKCIAETQKTKYAEAALFYLTMINLADDHRLANQYAAKYYKTYPNGIYRKRLEERLSQYKLKQGARKQ